MERKLIFTAAVLLFASPAASATDFLTTKSPDIFIAVPSAAIGHTAKITTKDGRALTFGYGINRKTWKVDAVIISVGGFLGVGSKCVAVTPASAQAIDQAMSVDLTLDELRQAPSFNNDSC